MITKTNYLKDLVRFEDRLERPEELYESFIFWPRHLQGALIKWLEGNPRIRITGTSKVPFSLSRVVSIEWKCKLCKAKTSEIIYLWVWRIRSKDWQTPYPSDNYEYCDKHRLRQI